MPRIPEWLTVDLMIIAAALFRAAFTLTRVSGFIRPPRCPLIFQQVRQSRLIQPF